MLVDVGVAHGGDEGLALAVEADVVGPARATATNTYRWIPRVYSRRSILEGGLIGNSVGRRVRVLRRDLDQLLAEAEASATSASQPGADAGQGGEGWPDAQAFWGGA